MMKKFIGIVLILFACFLIAEGSINFRGEGKLYLGGNASIGLKSFVVVPPPTPEPPPEADLTPAMTASDSPIPNTVNQDSFASTNYGWKAFDHASNTFWASSKATDTCVIYDLSTPTAVARVKMQRNNPGDAEIYNHPKDIELHGSANASDWSLLATGVTRDADRTKQAFSFSNAATYRYYKFLASTTWGGDNWPAYVSEIELWPGSYSEVKAGEYMTAADAPSPQVVISAPGDAWKAFDGIFTGASYWYPAGNKISTCTMDYGAGNEKTIRQVKVKSYLGYGPSVCMVGASNDGTNFVSLATFTLPQDKYWQGCDIANTTAYRYYMFTASDAYNPIYRIINEIEFMEAP